MLEIITDLLPPEDANPEQANRWRRSISVVVIATGALTMVNTWTMWGLFPVSLVFSGFATVASVDAQAGDLDKVQNSIKEQSVQMQFDKRETQALLLLGQLNQLFDSWCGAVRGGRRDEAVQWERQLSAALVLYNNLSARPYPMRSCG